MSDLENVMGALYAAEINFSVASPCWDEGIVVRLGGSEYAGWKREATFGVGKPIRNSRDSETWPECWVKVARWLRETAEREYAGFVS